MTRRSVRPSLRQRSISRDGHTVPGRTYANQRTALFSAIASRRTVFANDARLPGQQSAAPNIVINEIQHSPTAGRC